MTNTQGEIENESAPLDMSRLQMVAGKQTDKQSLLALFFRIAAEAVAVMEDRAQADNCIKWRNAAHSLKGSAANLGMAGLEKACALAESQAAQSQEKKINCLERVKAEVEYLKAYLIRHYPAWMQKGL